MGRRPNKTARHWSNEHRWLLVYAAKRVRAQYKIDVPIDELVAEGWLGNGRFNPQCHGTFVGLWNSMHRFMRVFYMRYYTTHTKAKATAIESKVVYEHDYGQLEFDELVEKLLASVPASPYQVKLRRWLYLYFGAGKRYCEIAKEFGCTDEAVRIAIKKAVEQFKENYTGDLYGDFGQVCEKDTATKTACGIGRRKNTQPKVRVRER